MLQIDLGIRFPKVISYVSLMDNLEGDRYAFDVFELYLCDIFFLKGTVIHIWRGTLFVDDNERRGKPDRLFAVRYIYVHFRMLNSKSPNDNI